MHLSRTFPALLSVLLAVSCAPDASHVSEKPAAGTLPPPQRYRCHRTAGPIEIDGRPQEAGWGNAPWTEPFIDIEGEAKPTPRFRTRMRMAWDDEYLYVAAIMEEPHVCGMLTEHDQIVYHDNDFEVFIDPDGDGNEYYEIEVNALNTIFDLLLVRPYRSGGPALLDWNLAGLQTAVHVVGTLNDPSDIDHAWSVELALPFSSLAEHAHRPAPPAPGDVWRMNFSRVQWRYTIVEGRYEKVPQTREDNWVWTAQGEINMHMPERWGSVEFVK